MSYKYKKLFQTIALALIFCLSNSFVFALKGGARASTDTAEPKALLTGVLSAPDVSSVKVNGNIAQDGMTILSGTKIETGKGGAVVKLAGLGKVEMAAETSINLAFERQNVAVQVTSGQAVLTTFKGVEGKLTDASGRVAVSDSSLEVSIIGDGEIIPAGATVPTAPAASSGFFGFGMWGVVAVAAGSVATWMTVANSTNDSQRPVSSVRP